MMRGSSAASLLLLVSAIHAGSLYGDSPDTDYELMVPRRRSDSKSDHDSAYKGILKKPRRNSDSEPDLDSALNGILKKSRRQPVEESDLDSALKGILDKTRRHSDSESDLDSAVNGILKKVRHKKGKGKDWTDDDYESYKEPQRPRRTESESGYDPEEEVEGIKEKPRRRTRLDVEGSDLKQFGEKDEKFIIAQLAENPQIPKVLSIVLGTKTRKGEKETWVVGYIGGDKEKNLCKVWLTLYYDEEQKIIHSKTKYGCL